MDRRPEQPNAIEPSTFISVLPRGLGFEKQPVHIWRLRWNSASERFLLLCPVREKSTNRSATVQHPHRYEVLGRQSSTQRYRPGSGGRGRPTDTRTQALASPVSLLLNHVPVGRAHARAHSAARQHDHDKKHKVRHHDRTPHLLVHG